MGLRGGGLVTLVVLWHFLLCHQEVDIFFVLGEMSLHTDIHRVQRMNPNDSWEPTTFPRVTSRSKFSLI